MREMYVYFSVESPKLDHAKLTKALGVKPTTTANRGDTVGMSKIKCRKASWDYRIDATNDFDLENLFVRLFKKMKGVKNMKKASRFGERFLTCVIYGIDSREPSLQLAPKTLKQIADLGCSLWIGDY